MIIDTILAGGTVVTDSRTLDAAVAVDEGRIVGVGDEDALPAGRNRIDATGQVVMPGVVDPHVHVDDHVSIDTYRTVSSAAALGGVTTFIDFAWQAYEGADSPWDEPATLSEGLERKRANQEQALVDFGLHGGILREDDAVFEEIPALVDDGVTSFKMYTAYEFGVSNGFLKRVFDRLAEHDAVGVVHSEDDSVCRALTAELRAAGEDAPETYPQSRPDYAEAMAASDAVTLATEAGAKYYGIHTTCRAAADALARHREDGSRVRAETCTHYTTLDDSVYAELGNLPKIAPPIRKEDDVEAMFEYLRRGVLSVVSTDHVASKRADKVDRPWWEGPFGANGVQVSLPVFHDEAVNERGLSYPFLVRVMCSNPAETFGLPNKGTLEPGTDADIVLFDPDETYTISADANASKADYSIYEGREVTGRVTKTLVRGEVVAADGEVVGDPGHGRFVERERPDWSA
ncbi:MULTISPECIES: dihydroorotase [Haloferax]|uniref:Amidohydrolase family protein n=1 Tax=Haloferax sp. Atlit-48N TaxID=2077198 RepID=A0ACD5I8H7_9EURY|nr:amidohydrolase family protein [Haloferax sp. Atlit-48N]RDZ30785.1 allantoinase [Haloferax sp. Atlit-48N]